MAQDRRKPEDASEIVEIGDIFFFYRPRIEEDHPDSIEDIQRFYMLLKPRGRRLFRLALLGRKRLPDVTRHERFWGFIEKIARSRQAIDAELAEQHYTTKTRGERRLPAARPAGEGVYEVIGRAGNLHLAYELELPKKPGPVQAQLNIRKKAAFVIAIRNPAASAPPTVGLPAREAAQYPEDLQREFGDRRFVSGDIRLLDYEGAEFILIGAQDDPERAYGVDLPAEHETPETADIFHQLKLSPRSLPTDPLLKGRWS